MARKKFSFTTQFIIAAVALFVIADFVLGGLLLAQSQVAMKGLMNKRMADIAAVAAASLDGDSLADLKVDDKSAPAYQSALRTLSVFQENADLRYIYCVRAVGDRQFVFTVDPAVSDPAEFGQEAAFTDALYNAGRGRPSVDAVPYTDRWGTFYSAYCPVFDSAGEVASIVVVDFDADWYDDQLLRNAVAVVAVSLASLVAGVCIALLLTSRLRRRFRALHGELSDLAADVENLTAEIASAEGFHAEPADLPPGEGEGKDEVSLLGSKIRATQRQMRQYVAYVHAKAYMDTLANVKNKTAYLEAVHALDDAIAAGEAAFAVAVFDINSLKWVNDNRGHELGDQIIVDSATVMRRVFGAETVYRIGGDEFIALLPDTTQDMLDEMFARVDQLLADWNRQDSPYTIPLGFSKGGAVFDPAIDSQYRQVFKRADEQMYADKAAYYRRVGDRRRHY